MSGTFIKERNTTIDGLYKFRSILSVSGEWNEEYWLEWHKQNWTICIPIAIAYLISVYCGTQFMKNRKPYNLRVPLGLWSGMLGVFSILGSYYFLPEIISKLYNDGFHKAACDNSFKSNSNFLFWSWLFTWSKVLEFGDTMFIILRKQKLTFLHWYHHAMTVICVFAYSTDAYSINRWAGSMNFFIHSIMYSYYSFKAFRVYIPRFVSFAITISQIAQMFIGFYVAGYIFVQKQSNIPCKMSKGTSMFSLAIYVSYFILFLNFFIRTYFMKKPSTVASSKNQFESAKLHLNENDNLSKQKVN